MIREKSSSRSPAKQSTGALLVLLIVGEIFAVRTHHAHAEWAVPRRFVPAMLVGVVVGTFFLAMADDADVRRVIGLLLLALVGQTRACQVLTTRAGRPAAVVDGGWQRPMPISPRSCRAPWATATTVGYQVFGGANGPGRYVHFKVSTSGASALFESYDLATGTDGQSCYVDANGNGGSAVKPTSPQDTPPFCGVPTAIKTASGLTSGQGGTINGTFGITGRVTAQNKPYANVPFKVVATQKDVRPDALNF